MFFRDIDIRRKLFIAFGIPILLLAVISIGGLGGFYWTRSAERSVSVKASQDAERIVRLVAAVEKNRRIILTALAHKGPQTRSDKEEIADATREVDEGLAYFLAAGQAYDNAEKGEIEGLDSLWRDFKRTRDSELMPAISAGRTHAADRLATGVQEERFNRFIKISGDLSARIKTMSGQAEKRADNIFSDYVLLYFVITACCLLSAISLLMFISKDIGVRLKSLTEAFEKVKGGNLGIKTPVDGSDEIGRLANSLNQMTTRLYEDKITQEQSLAMFKWYSNESVKRIAELEDVNEAFKRTQLELGQKNSSLEESLEEIKKINCNLEETRAQMIQSEKMASIGLLAAGVTHEINNPVGFIGSNLNILTGYINDFLKILQMDQALYGAVKDGRASEAIELLSKIEEFIEKADIEFAMEDIGHLLYESRDGIERVKSIVRGLKTFSHGGAAEAKECDINQCLEETIKVCWHEIKYKAELVKDLGALPPVRCNAQRISQVFMNIIINAAEAIPERGRIEVKTYLDGEEAVIEIADNGEGMPENVRKRIFEPFFTTKPVGKGTGLGLSIVYGIIKEHKGSIDVESSPGEGTRFTLRLPRFTESRLESLAG
ncbi:MAG: HAMP domain-containing protein [Deltaproteobacteria bacterium]|nr:HAMP domain-containing protein [Deltaproteobacteria bacterium]